MASSTDLESRIPQLDQKGRFIALAINLAMGWTLFALSTGQVFPMGNGASVWFLAMSAHWILTLVAAPYFLPPRDSFGTAVSVVLLLVPLNLSNVPAAVTGIKWLAIGGVALAITTALIALVAVIAKDTPGKLAPTTFRVSGLLGRGEVLFTSAVVVSVVGFYSERPAWLAGLLAFWTIAVAVRPVELSVRLIEYWRGSRSTSEALELVGQVARVDDPDIIRVRLDKRTAAWDQSSVYVAHLANGQARHVLPLFAQIQNDELIGTGLCCTIPEASFDDAPNGSVYVAEQSLVAKLKMTLFGGEANQVAGIIIEGSTIGVIKFQVLRDCILEEGTVVFADCRDQRVYYQVLDGSTSEESFQQNPFGAHIASAVQLGCYDKDKGFLKFPWLPTMNQPLFTSDSLTLESTSKSSDVQVGLIPSTDVPVVADINEIIEHHGAILGITGTGKTELVFDIVSTALANDAKVFCVDFTGEYKYRLANHIPIAIGLDAKDSADFEANLFAVETGTYGAPNEKKALKKFVDGIRGKATTQVADFLQGTDKLGLLDLGEITNSKATLRTTELYLSSIMAWAKRHKKARRILIVLEEAHTIIPETYGAGFDSDTQWVVSRIGQIGLQGRKYGVGLLLVSQRTALVSKTILSQCNTYFTYSLVDETSLKYLHTVYGAEHVKAVPNLRRLELIAFGKAVRGERPVLVRRVFDKTKVEASKAADVVLSANTAAPEQPGGATATAHS